MTLKERIYQTLPPTAQTQVSRLVHGEQPAQMWAKDTVRSLTRRVETRDIDHSRHLVGPAWRPAEARAVTRFDTWSYRQSVVDRVVGAAAELGVECIVVPGRRRHQQVVAVDHDDLRCLLARLAEDPTTDWRATHGRSPVGRSLASVSKAGTPDFVWLFELLATPDGQPLTHPERIVRLDGWTRLDAPDVPRLDGGFYLPGTRVAPSPTGQINCVEPPEWEAAQSAPGHRVGSPLVDLLEPDFPIDLVYTWVDGADPLWRARKALAMKAVDDTYQEESFSDNRYEDHQELRYSLRSVEQYANWVRHIWIVTDGQTPPWLNADNPRVTVVDHHDIFKDPSALPVFNSHASESQLHHIEGLAEHYVYLNDDMFIGRPVSPSLFFHPNGILKCFPSSAVIDVAPRSERDVPVLTAAKQNRTLIERDFHRALSRKMRHTPYPQRRSLLVEMEERYPDIFDHVMRSRFRHPDDYAIPSSLTHDYALATGRSVPGRIVHGYQGINDADAQPRLEAMARRRRTDTFCLNDNMVEGGPPPGVARVVHDFLERYFPLPSEFEKASFSRV